jgi:hypothetical protein
MNYLLNIKRVCDFAPKNATVPIMGMVHIFNGELRSNTYAGSGIANLPPSFKGVDACVEASLFLIAMNSLGADCKVAMKDNKLILSNETQSIILHTVKDSVKTEIPKVPGVKLSGGVIESIKKIIPYCGHRQEIASYGLIYVAEDEVFTTDGHAFCKIQFDAGVSFQIHGQCIVHIYAGDDIALAQTDDNGVVYVYNDGFSGRITNPVQANREKDIQRLLKHSESFTLACDFEGQDFLSAAQMLGKLSCSYLCIGKGKISGIDGLRETIFSYDFPYDGDDIFLGVEISVKIAASCRAEKARLMMGAPLGQNAQGGTILIDTADCTIFARTIHF